MKKIMKNIVTIVAAVFAIAVVLAGIVKYSEQVSATAYLESDEGWNAPETEGETLMISYSRDIETNEVYVTIESDSCHDGFSVLYDINGATFKENGDEIQNHLVQVKHTVTNGQENYYLEDSLTGIMYLYTDGGNSVSFAPIAW